MIWVAFAAWLATAFGLLHSLWPSARPGGASPAGAP
jgi:hypothetical protein